MDPIMSSGRVATKEVCTAAAGSKDDCSIFAILRRLAMTDNGIRKKTKGIKRTNVDVSFFGFFFFFFLPVGGPHPCLIRCAILVVSVEDSASYTFLQAVLV
jgi:hypothetical protein